MKRQIIQTTLQNTITGDLCQVVVTVQFDDLSVDERFREPYVGAISAIAQAVLEGTDMKHVEVAHTRLSPLLGTEQATTEERP